MATEAEKIEDGGPAYPRIQHFVDSFGHMKQAHDGMSLRDWLAGQALPGLAVAHVHTQGGYGHGELAFEAYAVADAMIAARKVADDPAIVKPARELTDTEISTELFQLGQQVAEGFGEHGGSPGEWIYERRDELSVEQDRRAARKAGA